MLHYTINIAWSDEDEGYIATIPEFRNLSAFGVTYEEALNEAKVVAEEYIETFKTEGLPLPEPLKISEYSGQIRLRMPRDLHQKLTIEAQRQGTSLNTYMVHLLSMNYGLCRWLEVPAVGRSQIYVRTSTPDTYASLLGGEQEFNFISNSERRGENIIYKPEEAKKDG